MCVHVFNTKNGVLVNKKSFLYTFTVQICNIRNYKKINDIDNFFAANFFIPLLLLTVLYTFICRAIWKSARLVTQK